MNTESTPTVVAYSSRRMAFQLLRRTEKLSKPSATGRGSTTAGVLTAPPWPCSVAAANTAAEDDRNVRRLDEAVTLELLGKTPQ